MTVSFLIGSTVSGQKQLEKIVQEKLVHSLAPVHSYVI